MNEKSRRLRIKVKAKNSTCVFFQTDDTANHREIEPSFLNMRTESILTSLKVADIGILTKKYLLAPTCDRVSNFTLRIFQAVINV